MVKNSDYVSELRGRIESSLLIHALVRLDYQERQGILKAIGAKDDPLQVTRSQQLPPARNAALQRA